MLYPSKYDEALCKICSENSDIPFYGKIHPELLPYIGENYEKTRVILVAESHYIKKATIEEFKALNWYNRPVPQDETNPFRKYIGWFDTRGVVSNYIDYRKKGEGHTTFLHPSKVLLNLKNDIENEFEAFTYFAFMNYFQRPALNSGKSIKYDENDKKYANYLFIKIIQIIQPKAVVFLSKKAYYAFDKCTCPSDIEFKVVSHPTCPWWNRQRKDGGSGCEDFRKILAEIIK